MTIDPRSLKTFLSVCRAGSISAAARQMNISQPSISVTIAQLEQSVDTQLFERARSGIKLTPAGSALKRRAEAMETLLQTAEREVSLSKKDIVGPLVVGGTPGALASLVPLAVTVLKETHPRFELQILERTDDLLTELLRNQKIDLAIVTAGIDAVPLDIQEDYILSDPFNLIVGRQNDHLPAAVRLTDLANARWVLPDALGAFRRQIDALFIAAGAPMPANVIRCDSLLTTKAIVRRTDYVTILPRQIAAAELSIGVLRAVRLKDTKLLWNVGVRKLSERQLPAFAEEFLKALRRASDNP